VGEFQGKVCFKDMIGESSLRTLSPLGVLGVAGERKGGVQRFLL